MTSRGLGGRRALGAMTAAIAAVGFTTTAITVGARGVADELGVGLVVLGWVVNAFLLAAGTLALLGGRLGDIVGRGRAFGCGVAVFGVGSVLGALAPGADMLIAGRALQGVGAAVLVPTSIEVALAGRTREERVEHLRLRGITYVTAFAIGPLIGGLLTDHLSWRAILWSGGALAVVAGALGWPAIHAADPERRPTRDWRGAVLAGLLAAAVVTAAERSRVWGARSPWLWVLVAVVVVLGVALVRVERRTPHPLLHPDLLADRQLVGANIATFGASLGMVSLLYFFNVFAQSAVLFDAAVPAVLLAVAPFILTMVVFAHLAGWLNRRVGLWAPAVGGMGMMVAGFYSLAQTTTASSEASLALPLVVCGIGAGIANAGLVAPAVLDPPGGRHGEAAGLVSFMRFVGSALALAVGTTTYLAVSIASPSPRTDAPGVLLGGEAFSQAVAQLDTDLQGPFRAAMQADTAQAFANTMQVTAVLVAASLLAGGWLLRPRPGPRWRNRAGLRTG